MDHFEAVRRSFAGAGVDIHSYYFNLRDDTSDGEIARSFDMARALGARMIVSSSLISTVARIDPVAKRNRLPVALHNHSYIRPGELARPQDFAAALRGASPWIGVCLDVGHMTAANCDPLAFLGSYGDKVIALHLKDRKRNEGPDVPFGEGDTPLRETLLWAASRPHPIPSMIEWESPGGDRLAQVKQCVEFCWKTLEVKHA
jgi:sugar phosphate isomerase/epimerase